MNRGQKEVIYLAHSLPTGDEPDSFVGICGARRVGTVNTRIEADASLG